MCVWHASPLAQSQARSEREREIEIEREGEKMTTNLTQKYFQGVICQNDENKFYKSKFSENYLREITHSARNF